MNAYTAAKSFAQQINAGDVKVKHEHAEGAAGSNAAPF
jgi:hypothetical protein